MSAQSLDGCLEFLEHTPVFLEPTTATYWFAGYQRLSAGEVRSIIQQTGLANFPAVVHLSTPHIKSGVYGVASDGVGWLLFSIIG